MKLGRPSRVSPEARRLSELRSSGMTWAEVAAQLKKERIPSGNGAVSWHAASAHRLAAA